MNPAEILSPPRKIVELSIPFQGSDSLSDRIEAVIENGYNVIVLDTFVPSIVKFKNKMKTMDKNEKKRLLMVPEVVKLPENLRRLEVSLEEMEIQDLIREELDDHFDEPPRKKARKGGKHNENTVKKNKNPQFDRKIKFLNRVTIELEHPDDQHKLRKNTSNPHIFDYDIIAVLPKNYNLLHSACLELDVDLITLDLLPKEENPEKLHYLCPKRHSILPARKRNIFFEFRYSNIFNPISTEEYLPKLLTCINLLLSNTAFCGSTKSVFPNIVFSSHLNNKLENRSYADLNHFLDLFEFSADKSSEIVRRNPLKVLCKAFQRKTSKGAVFVEKVEEDEQESDDKEV